MRSRISFSSVRNDGLGSKELVGPTHVVDATATQRPTIAKEASRKPPPLPIYVQVFVSGIYLVVRCDTTASIF